MELGGLKLALKHQPWRDLGIVNYARFVDNLIFALEDETYVDGLLERLGRIAPYRGKLEESGVDSFDFPDCRYRVQRQTSSATLIQEPIVKVGSKFLDTDSAHPYRIYLQWPVAFIRAIW